MNARDNFIAKAKAEGYTDGQINAFLAKEQQTAFVANSQPQAQPKKGTIADYLPTVFGTLGGVVGSGLGAVGGGASTAGLGALPAGIAGAAAGSGVGQAIGEGLRQKLTGEKTDVSKIAKEGGLGTVYGGAGELVGAGLRAVAPGLKTVGSGLLGKAVNPVVKASPTAATQEAKLVGYAAKNLKGGTSAKMYSELPAKFAQLSQQADDFLKVNNPKVSKIKATKAFRTALGETVNFDQASPSMARKAANIESQIKGLSGDAKSLYAYKQKLSQRLSNAFKKLELGNPLTANEEIEMAAWRSIDDMLPKGLKEITREQSTLYDLATGLSKGKNTNAAYVGFGGFNAGVPAAPTQVVTSKLGRAALGLSESIPRSLDTPVGKAKLFGSVQLAGKGLQSITGGQELAEQPMDEDGGGVNAPVGQGASRLEAIQQQLSQLDSQATQANERVQQALAYDLMTTGGKNLSKIEALSKLTAPKAPKFSDTAIKAINESTTGLRQLRELLADLQTGNQNRIGPGYGWVMSRIPGTETQKLQAKLNLVKQTIGKAVEGGVLRKEDEAKYNRILPTVNDTIGVALYKIAQLENFLADDVSSFIELQGNLGGGNLSGAVGNTNSTLSLLGLE